MQILTNNSSSKIPIPFCLLLVLVLSFLTDAVSGEVSGSGKIGSIKPCPSGWQGTSTCAVRIIDCFEPLFPKTWGLGGAPATFTAPGAYYAPFARPYLDSIRGNCAEIHFPATTSSGIRELNCYLPPDQRMTHISFFARSLQGSNDVTLRIGVQRQSGFLHFSRTITLANTWKRFLLPLDSFLCQSRPGFVLPVSEMATRTLQIVNREPLQVLLIDDLVAESSLYHGALFRVSGSDWAFTEGSHAELRYMVSHLHDTPLTIRLKAVTANNANISDSATVKGKGLHPITFTLSGLRAGYHEVRLSIDAGTAPCQVDTTELADHLIIVPAKPKSASPIAVNMSALAYSDGHFSSLVRCGIRTGRVHEFQWPDIEPLPGQVYWDLLDHLAQCAQASGFRLMPVTGYAPSWAIAPPAIAPPWTAWELSNCPPVDTTLFVERIESIVRRYASRMPLWELWNEPNLNRGSPRYFFGNSGDYLRLFRLVNHTFRQAAPNCTLITGGLARHRNIDPSFARSMADDKKLTFSAFGFHAYQKPEDSDRDITTIRKRQPEAALYMTEVGDDANDADSASVRSWNVRMHRYAFHFFVQGIRQWTVHWFHPDMVPVKHGTQLLYFDGAPTSRMAAIAVLARMTSGMKSAVNVAASPQLEIYRIVAFDGERLLCIGTGTVNFTCKGTVTLTDGLGTERKIDMKNNRGSFRAVRDDVAYLSGSGFTGITTGSGLSSE